MIAILPFRSGSQSSKWHVLNSRKRSSKELWFTKHKRLVHSPCTVVVAIVLGFSKDSCRLTVTSQLKFDCNFNQCWPVKQTFSASKFGGSDTSTSGSSLCLVCCDLI